ncbi:MAG: hypothetical protein COV44_09235 [Deltaproteobacteria bacterium CG11_big_fil_rev_8_21_14_0_20_45_16]|nr:MAG: hypothetical protein COV44_09235 [Deltaproteobacteria bacterium CG11_big_fil_rev_8_21_14_0_20_45_16]
MELKKFFEIDLNQKLASHPEALANTSASYQLNIGGEFFSLNLAKERKIYCAALDNADCSIQISKADFEKLVSGSLNIPLALTFGKIKIKGDLLLFAKLRELFK